LIWDRSGGDGEENDYSALMVMAFLVVGSSTVLEVVSWRGKQLGKDAVSTDHKREEQRDSNIMLKHNRIRSMQLIKY
jgi:hypothetical protein